MDRRDFIARASAVLATLGVMGRVTVDRDLSIPAADRQLAQTLKDVLDSPLPSDAQLYAEIVGPRVRTGLPPLKWRRLGKSQMLADIYQRENEVLRDIPWVESGKPRFKV